MKRFSIKEPFKILIVDDEIFNLEILKEILTVEKYEVTTAEHGQKAWEFLKESPDAYDVVILDRRMPMMTGIEVLKKMKAHPILNRVPVIFQTAQTTKEEILEGLQTGAYYYLTKPFNKDQLLAIVKSAAEDFSHQKKLIKDAQKTTSTLALLKTGFFMFSTLAEGQDLAILLGRAHPSPDKVVVGLSELLVNAVEHGNLGITYEEKSELTRQGTWKQEINRRTLLPENQNKSVTLEFEHTAEALKFLIKDQGQGFDWGAYLDFSHKRAFDLHGRGIAMAKRYYFDTLEYRKPGNEVLAVVNLI